MLTLDQIRTVPKVLLHDHLDGGLRPQTVLELARETGYRDLPGDNVAELTKRLTEGAHRGHLEIYLDAFRHTVAVMQTPDALRRVAAECAEDLAADGVVYAEVRFAPELHTERGLSLDEVVQAVLEGLADGSASQAAKGRGIRVYALLTAMRTAARSLEIAELAVRYRDQGVVGFDIAGAEAGWPPSRHLDAFQYLKRENFTSRSTRARRSGCPRSGRRCNGAAPSGSATESASRTTSRSVPRAMSDWGAWRPISATAGFRWKCARPRTSRPVRHPRSRGTRSGCCGSCPSG